MNYEIVELIPDVFFNLNTIRHIEIIRGEENKYNTRPLLAGIDNRFYGSGVKITFDNNKILDFGGEQAEHIKAWLDQYKKH